MKPYIIGLTGGIASGKSTVAEKLEKLGAGLVNCDKIAHDVYLPGKSCFNAILEIFGPTILKSDGFIDRKALGAIVFNDKASLLHNLIFFTFVAIIILYLIVKSINLFLGTVR